MYMDSTCYTCRVLCSNACLILNWCYYHNRIKQYINGKVKTKYFGDICCKL